MKKNRKRLLLLQTFATLGNGVIGIFFPFLLGQAFDLSFTQILLWGAIFELGLCLFVYPINLLVNKLISPKKSILLGLILQSVFLSSLVFPEIPGIFWISSFLFLLHICIFWPNFHTAITESTDSSNRGNFLGNFQMILVGINIIAPIITGYLLEIGRKEIIILVSIICFCTAIYCGRNISIKSHSILPFKKFLRFSRTSISPSTKKGFITDGIQSGTMWLIWPIYLKIVLKKFSTMGALISIAAIVEIGASKFFGKKTDKHSAKNMLHFGIFARMVDLWNRITLIFFSSPLMATPVLMAGGILGPLFQIPFYTRTGELAEENKDHLLEFYLLRETYLGFMRFIILLLAAGGVFFFGNEILWIFFFIAGLSTLLAWKY